MQIGDRRTELAHFGEGYPRMKTGTVVYIHPRRVFYIVEFEVGVWRWQESYFFPHRAGTLREGDDSAYGNRPGEKKLEPHKCYKRDRLKPEKGIEP